MMALDIDKHFRRDNVKRYVLQCGLAGLVVLVLLFVLDAVTQTVLIAALGVAGLSIVKQLVLPALLDLI